MNPWQTLIEGAPHQRKDWPEPVKTNGRNLNVAPTPVPTPAPPLLNLDLVPPMDEICRCGRRYGQHRVNTFECPNQNWRPGNGQPQWLLARWKRA